MSFAAYGKKTGFVAAVAAAWLSMAGTAVPAPGDLPPGVGIYVEARPESATVGDPIRVDLEVTLPPGFSAQVPRPDPKGEEFSLLSFDPGPAVPPGDKAGDPAGSRAAPDGAVRHRARAVIAYYRTGQFTFPPIRLKIRTADGREISAAGPPVKVEIRSVLDGKDPALRGPKKQAEIPDPARWLLWLLPALVAGVLFWILRRLWRRRERDIAPLTPAERQDLLALAEADLKSLLARGFPQEGKEKPYYVRLSDVVKRILGAGYGIPTAEKTTAEIMNALEHRAGEFPEAEAQVEPFLLLCDLVKFAKYVPSREEHEVAAEDALGILAKAREAVGSRQPVAGS